MVQYVLRSTYPDDMQEKGVVADESFFDTWVILYIKHGEANIDGYDNVVEMKFGDEEQQLLTKEKFSNPMAMKFVRIGFLYGDDGTEDNCQQQTFDDVLNKSSSLLRVFSEQMQLTAKDKDHLLSFSSPEKWNAIFQKFILLGQYLKKKMSEHKNPGYVDLSM